MTITNLAGVGRYQHPVNLIEIAGNRPLSENQKKSGQTSFTEMFSVELAQAHNLSFSQHAQQRLHSRHVALSAETVTKLADGVDRAQMKGSRETLVLTDEAAFVVNVRDRNVITVFDRDNLREGVVTSIDSAVIV